jgi:hypothetical protein
MELINELASEDVANHLFWIVTDALQQTMSTSASETMIIFLNAGVLTMVTEYDKKYGLSFTDIHAWVVILPILPTTPQEPQNHLKLVKSMSNGMKNQDPLLLQKLQDLCKPLLQFAAQPPQEYSLESALSALQNLTDTYVTTMTNNSQEIPLSPHTVVVMDV